MIPFVFLAEADDGGGGGGPTPLDMPTFTPTPGTYNRPAGLGITMHCVDPATHMHYTTDESDPTLTTGTNIAGLSGGITLGYEQSVALRVIAIAADNSISPVRNGEYDNTSGS